MMARNDTTWSRVGGLKPRSQKLLAICGGCALLLCSAQVASSTLSEGVRSRRLADKTAAPPTVLDGVATCQLGPKSKKDQQETASITLSGEKLKATLKCNGRGSTFIPTEDGNVCVNSDASVITCANEKVPSNQVLLKNLLRASSDIKVAKNSTGDNTNGWEWTLELEKSQLPRSDTTFFVGCKASGDVPESTCKLDIHVEARESSVQNGVVFCSYGAASNGEEPLTVDMTQENNKLTIDCGDEGSLKPAGFNNFCTSDDKDLETCSKQFVEMFPNFQKSWWQTTDAEGSPATLTIPPSDFPSEEKQFLLGCAPTKKVPQGTGGRAADGQPVSGAGNPSTCKVLVTVKAASSSASAMSALPMAAGVSGAAAVVTGLLARAF
ncbi:SAG-related sequence [Besnoitia besnoiti]|uniref:SAG-related sequence n=1 Tax=Besnoitia besnoiti TaxID=94643 RepID=A0A2A9ME75_BESBE|nr:SAG-related sequence [Besnoitia besnoiti]PFH36179.1 SAG-related sequence [Besnoitia besnoiti]